MVEDPSIPVSYLDVYETLADLIGTKTACNEAPDSRSLMTLLEGTEPSTKLKYSKIFTHAKKVDQFGFDALILNLSKNKFKGFAKPRAFYVKVESTANRRVPCTPGLLCK